MGQGNCEVNAESKLNMDRETMEACKYMLHLMKCALNEMPGELKPEQCSWKKVYGLISKNNVQGLTYYAVQSLTDDMPEQLAKMWKTYRDTVIYKKLMMEEERNAILSDLCWEKISFLLLKGCNIEKYYPKPGMRDMADNDILYGRVEQDEDGIYHIIGKTEEEREQTIRATQKVLLDYMKKRGYETSGFYEKDDVCNKGEFYSFEMHRDLMDPGTELLKYYKNPWKNAIKNDDSNYEYHFSPEDEYLFYIAHEYKHYSSRGCGVRNLADFYVFLREEEKSLDWEYIKKELEMMNLSEFEAQMRRLAFDALSPKGVLDEQEEQTLYNMCLDGTFGHFRTSLQRRVKNYEKEGEGVKKAKRRYYFYRFFPPDDFYEKRYPFFYRHRPLRPLLTVYRTVKGLLFHRKHLKKEMKDVLDTK
ncbi:MAG: nucleotidyltransferase family protein [Eubacterium sp.]|nr:nucleotidyltransferase family protein [Eubacterium sp.]